MKRSAPRLRYNLSSEITSKKLVYLISLAGNPLYVGATVHGLQRINYHFLHSTWRLQSNMRLYAALKTIASAGAIPTVTILETLPESATKKHLRAQERLWTKLLKPSATLMNENFAGTPSAEVIARRKPKIKSKRRAPKVEIICVETGKVFESIHAAAKALNLEAPNICGVLSGKRKTTGKLHFKAVAAA